MPADPATLAQNPFALLSLIASPAVLTNAASGLALSTSNRFLRASERMRGLATRYDEAKPAETPDNAQGAGPPPGARARRRGVRGYARPDGRGGRGHTRARP